MIAADTNVIVRLLTGDDPEQAARARLLFETATIFLPKSVILETEWVLRRLYRMDKLVALPNVRCEDETTVLRALAWSRQGFDFADALHVGSSRAAARFVTFDQTLVRRASRIEPELAVSIP